MYKVTQIPFISIFNDKYVVWFLVGIFDARKTGHFISGEILSNLTRKGTLLALIQG